MASEMIDRVLKAEKEAQERERKALENSEKIIEDAKSQLSIGMSIQSVAENLSYKIFNII